jgi:hypothetical protein
VRDDDGFIAFVLAFAADTADQAEAVGLRGNVEGERSRLSPSLVKLTASTRRALASNCLMCHQRSDLTARRLEQDGVAILI